MSAQITRNGQTLLLTGEVDFANTASLYQTGRQWISASTAQEWWLDLSGLTHSNTVTVALIVQWVRGLSPQHRIQLIHLPNQLTAIMLASNLQMLLPDPP
jgi:ABC-type transporter Mla MlaB component